MTENRVARYSARIYSAAPVPSLVTAAVAELRHYYPADVRR